MGGETCPKMELNHLPYNLARESIHKEITI